MSKLSQEVRIVSLNLQEDNGERKNIYAHKKQLAAGKFLAPVKVWWLECGLLMPNIFTVQFSQQF
jgi:hypothetical protein